MDNQIPIDGHTDPYQEILISPDMLSTSTHPLAHYANERITQSCHPPNSLEPFGKYAETIGYPLSSYGEGHGMIEQREESLNDVPIKGLSQNYSSQHSWTSIKEFETAIGSSQRTSYLKDGSLMTIHPTLPAGAQWYDKSELRAAITAEQHEGELAQLGDDWTFVLDEEFYMDQGIIKRKKGKERAYETDSSMSQDDTIYPEMKKKRRQSITAQPSSSKVATTETGGPSDLPSVIKKGAFTDEERAIIHFYMNKLMADRSLTLESFCDWINDCSRTEEKRIFWATTRALLPNREGASVLKHVKRMYHLKGKGVPWTGEEVQRLLELVASSGTGRFKWVDIGIQMGRLSEDCRDRWRNHAVSGGAKANKLWSEDEIELLKTAVNAYLASMEGLAPASTIKRDGDDDYDDDADEESAHGGQTINFTYVSKEMGGIRSRRQCRLKWSQLNEGYALRKATRSAPTPDVSVPQNDISDADIIWLLKEVDRIRDSDIRITRDIPWKVISERREKKTWRVADLKARFRAVRDDLGLDSRRIPLQRMVDTMLDKLGESSVDENSQEREQAHGYLGDISQSANQCGVSDDKETQAGASTSVCGSPSERDYSSNCPTITRGELSIEPADESIMSDTDTWLDEEQMNDNFDYPSLQSALQYDGDDFVFLMNILDSNKSANNIEGV